MGFLSHFDGLRERYRRYLIRRRLGIVIPADVYLAPTAQFQLASDGWHFGGTIRIERGVRISDGVILAAFGGSIVLEENVYVGPYCVLYGHGGLRVGRDSLIAAHSVLIPGNHRFTDPKEPIRNQGVASVGITIGKDVWIGCGARILDGVNIGDGCVIGAGAVVNRSIEANSIAVGVPARVIGRRGRAAHAAASTTA